MTTPSGAQGLDLRVITHMILGLPGETLEMMVQTAHHIGQSGADGIKLHLLHVLSGTDLAEEYAAGNFETMTLDAYILHWNPVCVFCRAKWSFTV